MITGSGGLLGAAMAREGRRREWEVLPVDARDLYVLDAYATRSALTAERPDVLVHCLVYADADRAEAEPRTAMRVNRTSARNVASACASLGCIAVFPSSYMVFDGTLERPYRPADPPAPAGAWGRSLQAAEEEVRNAGGRWMVVRTGWAYGEGGGGPLERALAGARSGTVQAPDRERVSPVWSRDLARAVAELVVQGARGVFHVADRGTATPRELVATALAFRGVEARVEPERGHARGRAPRPRNGVLDSSAAEEVLGREMPHWRESLEEYVRMSDHRAETAH